MTLTLLFWGIYILALVVGFITSDRTRQYWFGYPVVVFILIGILGWAAFGAPVKGH